MNEHFSHIYHDCQTVSQGMGLIADDLEIDSTYA